MINSNIYDKLITAKENLAILLCMFSLLTSLAIVLCMFSLLCFSGFYSTFHSFGPSF
jgi:hypothetical protein